MRWLSFAHLPRERSTKMDLDMTMHDGKEFKVDVEIWTGDMDMMTKEIVRDVKEGKGYLFFQAAPLLKQPKPKEGTTTLYVTNLDRRSFSHQVFVDFIQAAKGKAPYGTFVEQFQKVVLSFNTPGLPWGPNVRPTQYWRYNAPMEIRGYRFKHVEHGNRAEEVLGKRKKAEQRRDNIKRLKAEADAAARGKK